MLHRKEAGLTIARSWLLSSALKKKKIPKTFQLLKQGTHFFPFPTFQFKAEKQNTTSSRPSFHATPRGVQSREPDAVDTPGKGFIGRGDRCLARRQHCFRFRAATMLPRRPASAHLPTRAVAFPAVRSHPGEIRGGHLLAGGAGRALPGRPAVRREARYRAGCGARPASPAPRPAAPLFSKPSLAVSGTPLLLR